MNVRDELIGYLERSIRVGDNQERNIAIVTAYHGFRDKPWPTLEQVAEEFGVGTRERVRQIIQKSLPARDAGHKLPLLQRCATVLADATALTSGEYLRRLQSEGIEVEASWLVGMLNLMSDLEMGNAHQLVTPEFVKLTRGQIGRSGEFLIVRDDVHADLRLAYQAAAKLPGQLGIANLQGLRVEEGWPQWQYDFLKKAIALSEATWHREEGEAFWYIFENRDNTLLNYAKKVFLVASQVNAGRLAQTYNRALYARTARQNFEYPDAALIKAYLQDSIHFQRTGDDLVYLGETGELVPIEREIVTFLRDKEAVESSQLRTYLREKGFSDERMQKPVFNSPLVHVDESQGRKHFRLSLVGSGGDAGGDVAPDPYLQYSQRLQALLEAGTDIDTETSRRAEQSLLQDWLFKGKAALGCAICGREFQTGSLVAAHKKRRADCTTEERLDPYIVMPLCALGCDFLYERGYLYVRDAVVRVNPALASGTAEYQRAVELAGRPLEPRWVAGNAAYFRQPAGD